MTATVVKGSKVTMRFADGSTLEWKPTVDFELPEAIYELERLQAIMDRPRPAAISNPEGK